MIIARTAISFNYLLIIY